MCSVSCCESHCHFSRINTAKCGPLIRKNNCVKKSPLLSSKRRPERIESTERKDQREPERVVWVLLRYYLKSEKERCSSLYLGLVSSFQGGVALSRGCWKHWLNLKLCCSLFLFANLLPHFFGITFLSLAPAFQAVLGSLSCWYRWISWSFFSFPFSATKDVHKLILMIFS